MDALIWIVRRPWFSASAVLWISAFRSFSATKPSICPARLSGSISAMAYSGLFSALWALPPLSAASRGSGSALGRRHRLPAGRIPHRLLLRLWHFLRRGQLSGIHPVQEKRLLSLQRHCQPEALSDHRRQYRGRAAIGERQNHLPAIDHGGCLPLPGYRLPALVRPEKPDPGGMRLL